MWRFTNTCNTMFWMSLISTDWQFAVLREKRLRESGTAPSSPKSAFPPPFPWLSCICTNSTSVHCAVTLAHLQSTSFATCHLQILWMCDWILSSKRKEGASNSITLGISSWAVWQVCPKQSLSLFSVRGLKQQNLISRLNFYRQIDFFSQVLFLF